jgi:pimeloyl-ACP methyl ester carboxylesterase
LDGARSRLRRLFGRRAAEAGAADQGIGGEEGLEALADEPEAALPAAPASGEAGRRDRFYTSADGLRLHVVEHGETASLWLPVVCLPGLSRNARDFDALGRHLASHPQRPRRVLAFDLRGRGASDWDKDLAHYTPIVEMQDVLDGMAALGVDRAVVIGTSRGGLIAMLMGVARPAVLAGVVLNDIGPALEARGLARLKTYVGRMPDPNDWDDAAVILERLHGRQFPALGAADWQAFARMTWRDVDGMPASDYDPALARTFDGIEFDQPMPNLWPEFGALAGLPMMAIRGGNSDLLSPATLARMAEEHPGLMTVEVAGEGHAPLLIGRPILDRIAGFVAAIEGAAPPPDALGARTAQPFDVEAPEA